MNFSISPKLIIITDNKNLLNDTEILTNNGISFKFFDANQSLKYFKSNKHQLEKINIILIDQKLANLSSVQLCTIFKTNDYTKNIPIIMIGNCNSQIQKIKGIESGADEVLDSPLQIDQLLTVINNVSLRIRLQPTHKKLSYQQLNMDLLNYKVSKSGQIIHLRPTEFKILQCLMEYPKKILSRKDITSYVWGHENQVAKRTIDVHINRLRLALNKVAKDEYYIKTIRAGGYCLGLPI